MVSPGQYAEQQSMPNVQMNMFVSHVTNHVWLMVTTMAHSPLLVGAWLYMLIVGCALGFFSFNVERDEGVVHSSRTLGGGQT